MDDPAGTGVARRGDRQRSRARHVPESEDRYVLCLVPLYLIAARYRAPAVWAAALSSCAALAVAFQILFNLGGWFT